jgi:hypothetical protein
MSAIIRRTLATADIYIVMLTARQALSSADVALLRILRGLQKDRIAVFVNRIDELPHIARDCPAIIEHARAERQREFPTAQIPVVARSALWAETAIAGSERGAEEMLTEKLKAYAALLTEPAGSIATTSVEILLMCSGLSIRQALRPRKFTLIQMGAIEFLREQNNCGETPSRQLRPGARQPIARAAQVNVEVRIAELRQQSRGWRPGSIGCNSSSGLGVNNSAVSSPFTTSGMAVGVSFFQLGAARGAT